MSIAPRDEPICDLIRLMPSGEKWSTAATLAARPTLSDRFGWDLTAIERLLQEGLYHDPPLIKQRQWGGPLRWAVTSEGRKRCGPKGGRNSSERNDAVSRR